MEKIISIQPAPIGLKKTYQNEDGTEFGVSVLFVIFSLDEKDENDFTSGPIIHCVTELDIDEGYYLFASEQNHTGAKI